MKPSLISNEALLEQLRWRYATKQFDPTRQIPADDWSTLEEALVLTPSSFGLQPWKFLVVTDPAIKESLVPFSWGQQQVADCSHLVVFAHRKEIDAEYLERFLQSVVETRGVTMESLAAYRGLMESKIFNSPLRDQIQEWNQRQTYTALGCFMTCAALRGIDTCPMEGFEVEKYDEILGLAPRGLSVGLVCPAGYRAPDDRYAALPKVRFETRDLVEHI
ncbi:MAG: NAD(P)H-dependent oxidoreductase [Verrucomicrobiota bacterium]